MLSKNTAAARITSFVAKASGARSKRPGLNACLLEELQQGAVLLVLRLDRLSHSMPHLVTLVEELREQGIGFRSIGDGAIDTTTADGGRQARQRRIPNPVYLLISSFTYLIIYSRSAFRGSQ